MKSERDRVKEVVDRLRSAGYPLVQAEARVPGTSRSRVDVLAWAADESGELVPMAAVELKRGQRPEVALPMLAQVRASLGTTDHYVVTDSGWFVAGSGLRTVEPVDGPSATEGGAAGEVRSAELAAELLQQVVWKSSGRRSGSLDTIVDGIASSEDRPVIETANGDVVAVHPTTLWEARRATVAESAQRDESAGVYSSPPAVATAVASLVGERLGGTVVDPFCGMGAFLWALQDRARREGREIEAIGRDLNWSVIQTASFIGETAPSRVAFEVADAFTTPLPEADVIVAAPPMGLRLSEQHQLQCGTSTRQADIAAVDVCLRALKPGGRAVFQLAPALTFQSQAEVYRDYLAAEYRVAALIGCPSGTAFGTQIKTVLIVIDKAPSGETFVAQLADDWEAQLAPAGPAMSAALAHIDASSEPAP